MKFASITLILSTAITLSSTFTSSLAARQKEKNGPEQSVIFNQQGWEFFQKGKYRKAVKFFGMAYLCNPSDSYAYSMRNFCYQEEILQNRAAIISLQHEISINAGRIEQIQNESATHSEITEALESTVLANQMLAIRL